MSMLDGIERTVHAQPARFHGLGKSHPGVDQIEDGDPRRAYPGSGHPRRAIRYLKAITAAQGKHFAVDVEFDHHLTELCDEQPTAIGYLVLEVPYRSPQ